MERTVDQRERDCVRVCVVRAEWCAHSPIVTSTLVLLMLLTTAQEGVTARLAHPFNRSNDKACRVLRQSCSDVFVGKGKQEMEKGNKMWVRSGWRGPWVAEEWQAKSGCCCGGRDGSLERRSPAGGQALGPLRESVGVKTMI